MTQSLIIILFVIGCKASCNDYPDQYNPTTKMCYGQSNPRQCAQYSGSSTCLCTNDCINRFDTCINNTITQPKRNVAYPNNCKPYVLSDVNCNNDGNGTLCPQNCKYTNRICIPSNINNVCDQISRMTCPIRCRYDELMNKCIPLSVNDICELNNETLACPLNCIYNNNLNKCMSTNPNDTCELRMKLNCPSGCKLNIRGDTCISDIGGTNNAICNKINIHQCPNGCKYDEDDKICKLIESVNNYAICEPTITFVCPYNEYTKDIKQYKDCAINPYDICLVPDDPRNKIINKIRYPVRLEKYYAYANIMCNYSDIGKCEMNRIRRVCCNN